MMLADCAREAPSAEVPLAGARDCAATEGFVGEVCGAVVVVAVETAAWAAEPASCTVDGDNVSLAPKAPTLLAATSASSASLPSLLVLLISIRAPSLAQAWHPQKMPGLWTII